MLKKIVSGLLVGASAAVAFWGVTSLYLSKVLPEQLTSLSTTSSPVSNEKLSMENAVVHEVVDKNPTEREFELYNYRSTPMSIPDGGGILSISIGTSPPEAERPTSFQVWLTDEKTFIIRTEEEIPTVNDGPPAKGEPFQFASNLVYQNHGFRKGNSTRSITREQIQRMKNGEIITEPGLNGSFRITKKGVVFFVPNKFEI